MLAARNVKSTGSAGLIAVNVTTTGSNVPGVNGGIFTTALTGTPTTVSDCNPVPALTWSTVTVPGPLVTPKETIPPGNKSPSVTVVLGVQVSGVGVGVGVGVGAAHRARIKAAWNWLAARNVKSTGSAGLMAVNVTLTGANVPGTNAGMFTVALTAEPGTTVIERVPVPMSTWSMVTLPGPCDTPKEATPPGAKSPSVTTVIGVQVSAHRTRIKMAWNLSLIHISEPTRPY